MIRISLVVFRIPLVYFVYHDLASSTNSTLRGKLTWNPKSWRFGSDDFPFQRAEILFFFQFVKCKFSRVQTNPPKKNPWG